jgi:uncharacterized membrane protein
LRHRVPRAEAESVVGRLAGVGLGRTRASRRRLAALGVLAAASAFGVSLVVLRFVLSGNVHYANLVWNLVLAWVPLALALVVYDRVRRGVAGPLLVLPLALWLIFLPNAPYLLTDFMLLRDIQDMPIWFDVTLLTTFGWTGLMLGFVSVYLVQAVAKRLAGTFASWLVAFGALAASSVGIYLGRYLRWNSWDLLVQPAAVLRDAAARLGSPQLIGMSLVTTAFLMMAYTMLYVVLHVALETRDELA